MTAGDPPQIAIDASSIVGPRTGIGYATMELVDAMLRQWPEAWRPPIVWVNSRRYPLPAQAQDWEQLKADVRRTGWPGRVLLRSWQYLRWPAIERFTGPAGLVHAPASYIPPVRGARRVVTVHDLYFHHAPGHVAKYGGRYFAQTFPRHLPAVDHAIAVSQFTRDELLRYLQIPDERVTIVPQGVNLQRFNTEAHVGEVEALEALGIKRPYLLCVATVEPRKNLVTLIEAYARARQIMSAARQRCPRLVIVGLHGWGMKALRDKLYEARLDDPEAVLMTGYLPDASVSAVYRQALALVFPSLYEGFGMPLLEAMASGCPVVCSEAGALPEVAGDAALYVNPRDSDMIARTLASFLADPHLRGSLRERGLERAKAFNWEATARGTIEVYRRVLST